MQSHGVGEKNQLTKALFKIEMAQNGNSSTWEDEAKEPPSNRPTRTTKPGLKNKTRREERCGSGELLLSERHGSEEARYVGIASLAAEHNVREAELTVKAIRATLRRGQGVPECCPRASWAKQNGK